MDWDNLRFFLALADAGSLSRAAEKLQVDHSTVARRIDALERELGVRLVERLSRAYRLTAEGEHVRDRAKEVEAGIADIARFASSVDRSPQRVVRVNGPPRSSPISARLLTLQRQHPACASSPWGEARGLTAAKPTGPRGGHATRSSWHGAWR
jgi:DNA-binding transcriptional LysR family regulator